MPKKLSLDEFINRANETHSNFYTYTKTIYVNTDTKVIITCPTHGDFEQRPYDHMAGRGCSKCNVGEINSAEAFIEKANQVHMNQYDYSKVIYTNNKTKVTITCPIHGDFKQAPANHIHGKQGCVKCGYDRMASKQTLTTETFIEKAVQVHGTKYDYSKVRYTTHDSEVLITCSSHGDFLQKPVYHLGGSNCPQCSAEVSKLQFNPDKETTLYYVYFPEFNIYKIGITNRSIKQRFYGDKVDYTIIFSKVYKTGYLAWKQEQRILKKNIQYKYDGPPLLSAGNSELFTTNIFPKGLK